MADQPSSSPARSPAQGISRKQLILMAVLGIGLIIVVLYGQPDPGTATTEAGPETAGGLAALPSRRPSTAVATSARKNRWPVLAIERVIQTNPFAELAIPAGPPFLQAKPVVEPPEAPTITEASEVEASANNEPEEASQTRMADVIADLKSRKVKMILRTNGKASALIGDRILQEGDVIDGFRVITIGPNGIIVRAALPN